MVTYKNKRLEKNEPLVTIFTPVYNRAYIIERLYQSLLRQTNYAFEWLIVDDGSTDNIAELVRQWTKDTQQFEIRFFQQKNGGKHRAINYGVRLACADAFFIVDSDDYLEEDTVDIISKYWKDIKENDRLGGIAGLRRRCDGEIIGGKPYFENFVDATNLERKKLGLNGDKAEVYKTDILRKYPFPEYEGERFITEAVVWNQIAYEGYNLRWINKCFVVCEYLDDGLTAKGERLFIENPKGWAHYMRLQKKCGQIDGQNYLAYCYRFYENEYTKIRNKEFAELLDIRQEELVNMIQSYTEFRGKLTELCADKKIAIYAYGTWGKKLKQYLDELDIRVEYIIDRKYANIKEVKAYSIDMDLPQIDLLFIALKDGAEDVRKAMEKKMPGTEIVLYGDIKPNI